MLVQENIERGKILGVVIGEIGRGLGVVHNNSPFRHTTKNQFEHSKNTGGRGVGYCVQQN